MTNNKDNKEAGSFLEALRKKRGHAESALDKIRTSKAPGSEKEKPVDADKSNAIEGGDGNKNEVATENKADRFKSAEDSYAEIIKKKRTECFYKATGKPAGSNKDAWYYVQIDKPKLALFKAALTRVKKMEEERTAKLRLNPDAECEAAPSINLADYGTVVASGWGKEPPPEIKKQYEDND